MKQLLLFCMGGLIANFVMAMNCDSRYVEAAGMEKNPIDNAIAAKYLLYEDGSLKSRDSSGIYRPSVISDLRHPSEMINLTSNEPSTSGAGAAAAANVGSLPGPKKEWPPHIFDELLTKAEAEFNQKTKGPGHNLLYFDAKTKQILTNHEYTMLYGRKNRGKELKLPGYKVHTLAAYAEENELKLRDLGLTKRVFGIQVGYEKKTSWFKSTGALMTWVRDHW